MHEESAPHERPRPRSGLIRLGEDFTALLDGLGAHAGGVFLLTPGEPVLALAVLAGLPRAITRPWERVRTSVSLPVADALRERRTVWVGGAAEMARRYPRTAITLPYEFPLAAVPLASTTTVYGAVFVLWPGGHPDRLGPGERARLAAGAAHLTAVLADADRAGRPVRAPVRPHTPAVAADADPLPAMVARMPDGMCALDTEGRLTVVTSAAADLLGAPVDRLLGEVPWAVLPWLRHPLFEDRYRAAVMSRRPTAFTALRPPGRWLSFDLYPDTTGISVRVTPTRPRYTRASGADTGPADDPAASVSAGAIYHILHLASALTEAVGVRDVVDLVADQIMPAFGGRALALLAARSGHLCVMGSRGYPSETVAAFDSTPLTLRTPGARTLLTGVPAFIESPAELERAYRGRADAHADGGLAAWAFLPLITSGRSVGACVLAFGRPRRFPVEERVVLNALGGLVAQALERARLYDAKQDLAHGLQVGLLPRALPRVPGLAAAARYLPGTEGMEIGGDFYDLIRVDADTVAAVIGDIQGHNVGAAALMGQVRTAVRAYTATSGGHPGEVLALTNRMLVDLDPGLFASCVYFRADLRRATAELARAGHPQPLLRTPDGRARVLDVPGGVLLGVLPDAHYPRVRVPFGPGSVLALYTDGLVEEPGTDMDDAVAALARRLERVGGDDLDAAVADLTRGAAEASQRSDDVALMLLRPGGPGPSPADTGDGDHDRQPEDDEQGAGDVEGDARPDHGGDAHRPRPVGDGVLRGRHREHEPE